jgi:hypothetical protein
LRVHGKETSFKSINRTFRNGLCYITQGQYDTLQQLKLSLGQPPLLPIKQYIFEEALNSAVKKLALDIISINNFKLTSQVTNSSFTKINYSIGRLEIKDIPIDGKFEFLEQAEQKDGSIQTKVKGWSFVNEIQSYKPLNIVEKMGNSIISMIKIPDNPLLKLKKNKKAPSSSSIDSIKEYPIIGTTVAGFPKIGTIVREYPQSAFDVNLKFVMNQMKIQTEGSSSIIGPIDKSGMGLGFEFDIGTTRILNISQLYMRYCMSSASLNLNDKKVTLVAYSPQKVLSFDAFDFGVGMQKKMYLRRLVPEAHELALTPDINLGLSIDGKLSLPYGKWTYSVGKNGEGTDVDLDMKINTFNFIFAGYATFNIWPLTKLFDRGITAILKMKDYMTAKTGGDKDFQEFP